MLLLSLDSSTPPSRFSLSVSLSASPLRCRVGSWEQKAGDRQDKSCFLILQLSASLLSGEKTASQDREFPARCIPAQLLSLTGRQADRKEAEGDGEEDGCRDRETGKQICGQVEKEVDLYDPADLHFDLFGKIQIKTYNEICSVKIGR